MPSLTARWSQRVVAAAVRQPWLTLAIAFVLVAGSVWLAATHLRYKTQRNDLVSAEKDCQRRWQKYIDAFGEDDDFVFVVRGDDRARMIAAVESLAARVGQRNDSFDRVFHVVDLRSLKSRSLVYLPQGELAEVNARLDDLTPLLGAFSPIGWHTLSMETLLSRAGSAQAAQARGEKLASADSRLLAEAPAILKAATKALRREPLDGSVWSGSRADDSRLTQPHYLFSADGKLAFVLARPKNPSDSFTPMRDASRTARALLNEVRADYGDLEFGLTGLPVLETDEMIASDEDSTSASWLALGGVTVLYLAVYRGLRYPLLTMTTLLTGTALALGWCTLTLGHLNILSATFAVMLIGLGDYGVLWVAHYDERRRLGSSVNESLDHSAAHAGPGIVTAAVTAALAFAATMLADFQAVAELGWIAGCGVLFCGLACFTVLPALIVVSEGRRRTIEAKILPFPGSQAFLPRLSSQPQRVLAVGAAAMLVLAVATGFVHYDANLLNMQARGTESVYWEEQLIEHSAGTTWDALSLATTREEALRLKAKYEATPGVGRVVEAASLVPADYEAKRPILAALHRKLDGLPKTVPDFSLVTSSMAQTLSEAIPGPASAEFRKALAEIAPEAATARLREFDGRLRRDLHGDLKQLHAVSEPGRIAIDDLPAAFRERSISTNGTYLVRAFAAESLWDYDALERFTAAAQSVDPHATGKSFRTLEGLRQMKAGFLRAGLAALAVIVVVLWLDFRSVKWVLLGLLPLALGLIATLGTMAIFGVALNPANLIALPLIVGVGVDNGVHVLHDFLEKPRDRSYRLAAVTGRGIAVASLTTILGFGTLMIARHRGMASLGLALTLGVTACMVASLVLLPAILSLWPKSRRAAAPPVFQSARLGQRVAA